MAENAATADLVSLANDLAAASGQGAFRAAQQVIQQTAQKVQAAAQANAPVRTGALRDSITIRYTDPVTAVIGPTVPYGVYQEFGTEPHVIRPKSPNGVLVFKIKGKTVFAKVVHHPGNKPHPFMRPALLGSLGDEAAAKLAEAGALLISKGRPT